MSFMIFDLKENKIGDVSYRGFTRYEGYNLFDFEIVEGEIPKEKNEFIVDHNFYLQNNLKIGERYYFESRYYDDFTAVLRGTIDVYQQLDAEAPMFFIYEMFDDDGTALNIYVKLNKNVDANLFVEKKLDAIIKKHYPVLNINYSYLTNLNYLEAINDSQSIFLIVMQLFISVVVFLLISSILTFSINKKRKDIGILKALGYKHKYIMLSFVIQILIIAIISSVIGVILSDVGLKVFQIVMHDENGNKMLDVIRDFNFYLFAVLIVSTIVMISTFFSLRKMRKVAIIKLIKS